MMLPKETAAVLHTYEHLFTPTHTYIMARNMARGFATSHSGSFLRASFSTVLTTLDANLRSKPKIPRRPVNGKNLCTPLTFPGHAGHPDADQLARRPRPAYIASVRSAPTSLAAARKHVHPLLDATEHPSTCRRLHEAGHGPGINEEAVLFNRLIAAVVEGAHFGVGAEVYDGVFSLRCTRGDGGGGIGAKDPRVFEAVETATTTG